MESALNPISQNDLTPEISKIEIAQSKPTQLGPVDDEPPRSLCPRCYKGEFCHREKQTKESGGIPTYSHIPGGVQRSSIPQLEKILEHRLNQRALRQYPVPNKKRWIQKENPVGLEMCYFCQMGTCGKATQGYFHFSHKVIPPDAELIRDAIKRSRAQEFLAETPQHYVQTRQTNKSTVQGGAGYDK